MPKAKKAVAPAAMPDSQATMVVTVYDGSRQPIQGKDFLIRIFDGFQNKLCPPYTIVTNGAVEPLTPPVRDEIARAFEGG